MRRNPPAKWVLPDVVDPATRLCYQIEVPDDPAHIAAFRGALLALASGYNWADDPTHKAKDVALVWREIIDNHVEFGCEGSMQIRACEDGCGIEYSTDGENWTCVDLSGCIATIWDEKLAGAFDDGVLGQGTVQQSPQAPPSGGGCTTWHVQLAPGEKWHAPAPFKTGDTVVVSNFKGGWSIGEAAWYGPQGYRYLLGAYVDQTPNHGTGDPLAGTANHMQVIGLYGTTYFDPIHGGFTVPANVSPTDWFLQADTALTGTPSGMVEFDVEFCAGGWTHTFYLYEAMHGWVINDPNAPTGHFVVGQGVTHGDFTFNGVQYRQLNIHINFDARTITHIKTYSQYTTGNAGNSAYYWLADQNGNFLVVTPAPPNGTNTMPEWYGARSMNTLGVNINASHGGFSGNILVTAIEVSGLGTDPFTQ